MAVVAAALFVGSALALDVTQAHQAGVTRSGLPPHEAIAASILRMVGATQGTVPGETVTVAADEPIPHLPGKRLVAHVVDYEPGVSSAAHHHPSSAFIYAYVVSGAIRSQVGDEPARVYRAGEAWFENPGSHHRVSANASDTEPARLLAVLVVDGPDEQLVIPDPR
ncbi:MAG: cupin domain-containing protein [Mesorhizobium sp.]|nr:cupin domain-containing protein [Mesorhizobium sp. M5C.F.Ca.IN.020.32.2.1]RUV83988.1 cupin domain-containing protein [Mesorhizobium sp. M5C.F.Ca.IN.020.14.1.1]RWG48541.1 MAG: cupin domain-containing protein [Mesorhizobium sp.]RWH50027.1 MAG: cupin domain-containing protein [Mesorhizobium sp.]RWH57813.1 MAG: cupin domain-containing protein [Mesorhizobium sp.]